ncbi:MAG: efflux RND transporter periplasmic adaptor subunit [Bacteroidales bacterium]|nr:efflux RND transporter periplasmic adaptor subunit [Bacteroidales bacterium]
METKTGYIKTKESKTLLMSFVILISVIAVVGVIGYFILAQDELMLQGEVECNEIRVSGKVPGRILELKVQEGDAVTQDQLLVLIDSPEVTAKGVQAMAAKNAALAVSKKAENGARTETIEAAKEQYERAKAAAEYATKSYNRTKNLFDKGVIAAQKFDEVEAQYKAALALEKAALSQYNMAKNGAQKEDKDAAQAQVARAQGAIMEINAYKDETALYAPIAGEIAEIFPKVGELVGTGSPIMSIVDLNDVWITFNVREDLLGTIKMGDILTATIPALGNKEIKLKVNHIKALGSYATWKATKLTSEYDTKTFEVKTVPVDKVKGLRPGMSAIVNYNSLKQATKTSK